MLLGMAIRLERDQEGEIIGIALRDATTTVTIGGVTDTAATLAIALSITLGISGHIADTLRVLDLESQPRPLQRLLEPKLVDRANRVVATLRHRRRSTDHDSGV